jgi:hypothetical protein
MGASAFTTAEAAAFRAAEAAATETVATAFPAFMSSESAMKLLAPAETTAVEIAAAETFPTPATVTIESTSFVKSTSSVVATSPIVAAEPGTRADENSPVKVIRSIISVRCAGIRSIVVISVFANGRSCVFGACIIRSHADPHAPPDLSVSSTPGEHHEKSD